ncbi:MAG: transglutaminase domain-containing protein [Verrucomicrobia bacterium]|nr:transglutaminase domain-containing protein [Verrucomicrobiota bacterium]
MNVEWSGTTAAIAAVKSVSAIAVAVLIVSACGDCHAQAIASPVVIADGTARLIGLTAVISATNESGTPANRFVFRVTVPPSDLPHQRVLVPVMRDAVLKPHRSGTGEYLELALEVPRLGAVAREVKFLVLLLPADYTKSKSSGGRRDADAGQYLRPSRLIESDAPEVRRVADPLFAGKSSPIEKAKAAYEYPAKVLKFKPQPAAGALKALQAGSGDCTEFAALFCALCRAGGVAARMTGVFNLGTKKEITASQPNHNATEVFLPEWGWVPVDPNLGGGRYDRTVGFAKTGNSVILLNREGAWVWSTWLPSDGFASGSAPPVVKASLSWRASVVEEGPALRMLAAFANRQANTGKQ